MFDIDGTLVESYDVDSQCFIDAVRQVVGVSINDNWSTYTHVTDNGILNEFLELRGVSDKQETINEIKRVFIEVIKKKIGKAPIREVAGASQFLKQLKSVDGLSLSIATGGWYESAIVKLESAGIDFSGIPIASSDDHFDRVEIMKVAAARASQNTAQSYTYFGDGSWDKQASERLGFNFVLVGNKIVHNPSIVNFSSPDEAMACIELNRVDSL
jgi:phosphoglycolate phosphatase-like HAD superfamily hydrolase